MISIGNSIGVTGGLRTSLQNENKKQNMADNDPGSELRHAAERCDILAKIKSTVDGLFASGSHVTWSTYGGLARISDNIEQVLIHGSRIVVVSRNIYRYVLMV